MKTVVIRLSWVLVGLIVLIGVVVIVHTAVGGINEPRDPPGGRQRQLCWPTFSDDFVGTQLDPTRWQATYKSGDAERQTYIPEALQVAGGRLRITAQPRSGQARPYTSGIITTQGTFSQQYGYFEMRARVPHGQGLWSGFWLLHTGPLPWTEIDIFEILGNDTTTLYMSNHWRDDANQPQFLTQPFSGPDFSVSFHTFAVNWTPASLTWYVDGIPQAETIENVPAEPMFILANLAVGGQWPGNPDATTRFPAYMDIDYIRVYAPGCLPPGCPRRRP